MAVALLDSSAVIAYLLADDQLHASAAEVIERAVREGRTLAVSAVTWSELLHGSRLGYFPESSVRAFVQDLSVAVLAVDAAIAERGAALQASRAKRGEEGACGLQTRSSSTSRCWPSVSSATPSRA